MNSLSNIQLKEFGQTPEQIFFKPHPKKFSKKIIEIPLNCDEENKNKSNEENNKIDNEEKLEKSEIINSNEIEKNKEDINLKIYKDIKNENENKNEIINIEKEKKIKKYNNMGNIVSKPFPIISEINFKLKKQYKSVKKYDDSKLISGEILSEKNLILGGGINGHLNIYDYYTGDIIKSFSLSNPIENINSINKNNLIIYSSDYSINTFNTSLGKIVSTFFAHESKISNLFYDDKSKNFISGTKSGIIHIWDINQKIEIPIFSHFLFDQNNLIASDYNKDTQFYYSLDEEGKISIINIYNDEEIYNWVDDCKSNKPVSISVNYKNINEFIIGYEKGFKIFDVRNFNCVEDWTNNLDFKVNKCIIDGTDILIQNEFGLKLFDYKEKKLIGERKVKDEIGFFNFYNYSKNDTRIVYGDEKGNIFYSVI